MAETLADNKVVINRDDFKKIFHHLCLAAKNQTKFERRIKISPTLEKRIISDKINELENKQHNKSDDWIKNRIAEKADEKLKTDSRESEIKDIKNHILDVKKSYDTLMHNKNVKKEKLKAIKDRLLKLEHVLKGLENKR